MSETQREDGEHKPLVCGGYLWHDSPLERRASAASHTSTYLSCQCCHEHSCLFCEMKHVMNDSNYPVSMTASASGSARYHSSPILLRTPPQKRFLQNPSITSNHASALDMQRDANSPSKFAARFAADQTPSHNNKTQNVKARSGNTNQMLNDCE